MFNYLKSRHEKHYKNSKFHLAADMAFILIILSLLAAFILISRWQPKANVVLKTRTLSEQVKSGNLESFELSYLANEICSKNSLAVKLPDNFFLDSVEPAENFDRSTNTFYLNGLREGSNGKIKITGLVLGGVGDKSDFKFTFDCAECPGGIIQSLPYEIKASVLGAGADLPENIYRGVEFTGAIKVKNNGPRELVGLKIKINDVWRIKGGNELALDKIKSGEEKTIGFYALTGSDQDSEPFSFDYYLEAAGKFLKQGAFSQNLNIKDSNFKVFISPDKKIINADEEIAYTVSYQNQENTPLADVKFSLFSGNADFKIDDWSLNDSVPAVKSQSGILALGGPLKPGDGGKFIIKVKYGRLKAAANQEVYLGLDNSYSLNNQPLRHNLLSPKTKLSSRLKIKSGAYYFSPQGDQLGVGPLPPRVGMATSYWVIWKIENDGNDLENLVISADLPDAAAWLDNKSLLAGTLRYDELNRRVAWEVPAVAAQTDGAKYKAGLSLGVIPEEKDLGKTLPLLRNIKYAALDKFTGQAISGSLKDLSTFLEADVLSVGKGEVAAAE